MPVIIRATSYLAAVAAAVGAVALGVGVAAPATAQSCAEGNIRSCERDEDGRPKANIEVVPGALMPDSGQELVCPEGLLLAAGGECVQA